MVTTTEVGWLATTLLTVPVAAGTFEQVTIISTKRERIKRVGTKLFFMEIPPFRHFCQFECFTRRSPNSLCRPMAKYFACKNSPKTRF